MTPSERRRFVRSYYRIWGLLKVDSSEWQSRLDALPLRELYYLWEMTKLFQNVGGDEPLHESRHWNGHPLMRREARSDKRAELEKTVWAHIDQTYHNLYDSSAEYPWITLKESGYMYFQVMWDYWQSTLKYIVCQQNGWRNGIQAYVREEQWNDSEDDDDDM